MDYKEKYEQALERAKVINPGTADYEVAVKIFPELKKSEDEKIRKMLIEQMKRWHKCALENNVVQDIKDSAGAIAWLEKQGHTDSIIEKAKTEKQCVIITETDGNANIDWDTRSLEDARELLEYGLQYINTELEKQGEKKQGKTPIWNHWKDGIAGNGEGKLIYLIKKGNSYSLSSCLGYECDYILLSDLDKLMLQEKQGEQKTAEKVEPKFKVGDTIRPKGSMAEYTIESISGGCYHGKGWGLFVGCDKDYELVEQKPTEWSDRDWYYYSKLESFLEVKDHYSPTESSSGYQKDVHETLIWLKSLKERYTWKPSDEQMEALLKLEEMHVLEHEKTQENAHLYMVIKNIREQLQKLRKE